MKKGETYFGSWPFGIIRKSERERYRDKERDIMRKNKKIKRAREEVRKYETVSFTVFSLFQGH